MASGRFVASLAFSSVLLASCAKNTERQYQATGSHSSKSATVAIRQPRTEPLLECGREEDHSAREDKVRIAREVIEKYGGLSIQNLTRYIREAHNDVITASPAESHTVDYAERMEKIESNYDRVFYGFEVLDEQFKNNREAVDFMIALFRETPNNLRSFYLNTLRFKITYELGNMNDPNAYGVLMSILMTDPDAYSVRSMVAQQLTCNRNKLSPLMREVLFTDLVQSLDFDHIVFVETVTKALGEIRDKRALSALERALQKPANRDWVFSREALEEAILRLQS